MKIYEDQYYYLKYNEKEKKIHEKAYLDASEKFASPRNTTWIEKDIVCKNCDSNIVVCQPRSSYDYWYYCSNKMCENHWLGEELGDQEECSFSKCIRNEENEFLEKLEDI